ncbi:SagB/ThcOx family dehydrogenase [Candidatus Bathyarchaeota archaeon]|nr:SagB/ThcOx family dehydrogenase [Candidatus Bathyarchaeota archaeon]
MVRHYMTSARRMGKTMKDNRYGDEFQQRSKYRRGHLPGHRLDFHSKPSTYKQHESVIKSVDLPSNHEFRIDSFIKVLKDRRSRRAFSPDAITLQDLSTLLKFTTGTRSGNISRDNFHFRHVPSAGGLFPHETYVIANRVEGISRGLYHYNIPKESLDLLKTGDHEKTLARICLDQDMAYLCAAGFLWVAIIPRSKWKYLQRCYRYIYMDIGHVGQNFYLVSEALKLACCTIGAIYDDEGNEFIGLDGIDETLVYAGVVGKPS